MWWQGTDNAPDVVKLCWASHRRHCAGHKIILITKDNYQDYVTIPDYILSKVKTGYITLTHLSDIIRAALFAEYGGIWLDSTLFAADELPAEMYSLEYFTIKGSAKPDWRRGGSIALRRWRGYCLTARDPNSLLFCFMRDMFYEYWKTHNKLLDYLLIDYFMAVAYDEFPEFRTAWEKIPVNNPKTTWLLDADATVNALRFADSDAINKEWNAEEYARLTKDTQLFKLTYKRPFDVRTAEGSETVYGHLLFEYGIVPSE